MKGYSVHAITKKVAAPWIMRKHYAKRMPPISYCYGLFKDNVICGICTFGCPPSHNLKSGICGDIYKNIVFELNRLCLEDNKKNEASFLISQSLKKLKSPMIIVSFADMEHNHNGYIYQATNFIYCGLSAKRTDWKVKGKEHLHSYTIADEFRGIKNRSKAMREKYGDNFYLKERSRKHRYVYFIGSKKQKKEMLKALNYPILPYPKGELKKYDTSAVVPKHEYQPPQKGLFDK